MAKLFVTLSREEAENIAPVESTPMKGSEASDVIENAQDVAEETQQVEEMMASIEEAEDALDDLQEAENMAAASAGEEPVDVITGEPVAGAEESECCDETPGVTEPTPTGTEEAVAAPAPEVAAAVATECLRQVKKRLGMDSEGIQVSFESLDSRSPISSLQLAREGIGDAANKIWEAIKKMFQKIWNKIKELWGKFTGLFKKKVEVVEQIAEEIKEVESAGIKLSDSDFIQDEKLAIAKATAICIGPNKDPYENITIMSKKIAANVNAIKAAANVAAKVPAKAKNASKELIKECLEEISKAYSPELSANVGSTDKEFNKSDLHVVLNAFTGLVVAPDKNNKFGTLSVLLDGFNSEAKIAELAAAAKPMTSNQYRTLVEAIRTANTRQFPIMQKNATELSKAGEGALKDLEKRYKDKGDDVSRPKEDTSPSGMASGSGLSAEATAGLPKLGTFINNLINSGFAGSREILLFNNAIELIGKTTVKAAKRDKTPKEK